MTCTITCPQCGKKRSVEITIELPKSQKNFDFKKINECRCGFIDPTLSGKIQKAVFAQETKKIAKDFRKLFRR